MSSKRNLILTSLSVRQLINKTLLNDADLEAFCLDFFPAVKQRFSSGMDRVTKVNLLLELVSLNEIARHLSSFTEQVTTDLPESMQAEPSRRNRPDHSLDEHDSANASTGKSRNQPPVVWCSYSPSDRRLFDEIAKRFAALSNSSNLVFVAAPLDDADANLAIIAADVILFLLSVDYLADPRSSELISSVLEHYLDIPILTVLLDPIIPDATPLVKFAPPLLHGVAVSAYSDHHNAWLEVIQAARQAIRSQEGHVGGRSPKSVRSNSAILATQAPEQGASTLLVQKPVVMHHISESQTQTETPAKDSIYHSKIKTIFEIFVFACGGLLAFGTVLDALVNAQTIITPRITIFGTVAILSLFVFIIGARWTLKAKSSNSLLKSIFLWDDKAMYSLLGVAFLLWTPYCLPTVIGSTSLSTDMRKTVESGSLLDGAAATIALQKSAVDLAHQIPNKQGLSAPDNIDENKTNATTMNEETISNINIDRKTLEDEIIWFKTFNLGLNHDIKISYLIKDGKRHRIVSPTIIRYFYEHRKSKLVTEAVADLFPEGEKISYRTGMYVKHYAESMCSRGCPRYMIVENSLRPVSDTVAATYGCSPGKAVEMVREDIDGSADSLDNPAPSLKEKENESGVAKTLKCLLPRSE